MSLPKDSVMSDRKSNLAAGVSYLTSCRILFVVVAGALIVLDPQCYFIYLQIHAFKVLLEFRVSLAPVVL